jgi:putative heme transporter
VTPPAHAADGDTPQPPATVQPDARRDDDTRDARLGAAAARVAVWSARFLVTAATLAVLAWLLARLWVIVLPVILGVLLSTILWPPVKALRRFVPDAVAALAVLAAGLALLTGLAAWIVPQVASQVDNLATAASGGLQDLRDLVTGPPLNLGRDEVGDVVDQLTDWLQANARTVAGGLLSGVSTVGSVLVGLLLAVVICFFILKDGPRFLPWLSGLAGPRAAPHTAEAARRSWTTVSGFLRAQALVGAVDAVAIGAGLVILGIPLALPLSVLTFFGAFIPIVGATVTGILAALVALVSDGLTSALIVAAIVLVVQQVEGNVLQPALVGHTLDLHPVVVLLAVTAGGSLFGIVGAFLAVPLVAVAAAVVRYAREQLDGAPVPPPPEVPPGAADDAA